MAGEGNPRLQLGVRIGLPVLGAVSLGALLGLLFRRQTTSGLLVHPAVVAGCCWAGQLWYASYSLDTSRRSLWRHTFGLANTLTLFRGGLYTVVAGFVVVPPDTDLVWVPAVCYGVGVTLDKLDGTVARTVGQQTDLGTRLDMAFDTFGFVAAPLLAVVWGRLPVPYLALSSARYVYLAGIYWRRYRGRPVFDRPDSDLGRYLAGVQMVFLTVALAPVAGDLVWTIWPIVLAPSLAVFVRDFLFVSGRLRGHA